MAVLDCDVIAREVVEPGEKGLENLVVQFGKRILDPEGRLDRPLLRQMMIDKPEMKKEIEQILHPLIQVRMCRMMDDALNQIEVNAVAVEVPLLFESGMEKLFDITLAVVAKEDDLIKRISLRDGVNTKKAKGLLNLQMKQAEKSGLADYTIINNGNQTQLFDMVDKLADKIRKEYLTI